MTNTADKKEPVEPVRTWAQELTLWCVILAILICVVGVALYVLRADPPIKLSPEDVSRIGYFDAATGKPKVYFKRQKNGKFDLFDRPGFHPNTQEPLEPVTQENVRPIEEFVTSELEKAKLLKAQEETEQKRQAAEKEAELKRQAKIVADQQAAQEVQTRIAAEQQAARDNQTLDEKLKE